MKKIILNSVIIVITSIVLITLVFFTDGVQNLYDLVRRTNYLWLLAAFCCNVLFWIFGAITVGVLKRGVLGKEKDPGHNFKTVMVGQFFSAITPFATGGQPAQVYMMKRMGVDSGTGTSIVILKSALLQTVLFTFCIVLYFIRRSFLISNIPQFNLLFIIGCTTNLSLIALYALFIFKSNATDKAVKIFLKLMSFLKITKNPEKIYAKVQKSLLRFKNGVRILQNRKTYVFGAYIMQILQLFSLFCVPVFMMKALEGVFASSFNLFICTAMVFMIASLVPTPGTTGGVEALSLLFIAPFFVNSPKLMVVLIWRLLTYYSNIIFGGIFCLLIKEKPLEAEGKEQNIEIQNDML